MRERFRVDGEDTPRADDEVIHIGLRWRRETKVVEDDVVIRKAIEYRCDASLTLGTPVEVVCFSFELSRPFASALRFLRR